MKNYELMAFLAKCPADAEIEIWGPYFRFAGTIESTIDPSEPCLKYEGGTRNSVQITIREDMELEHFDEGSAI